MLNNDEDGPTVPPSLAPPVEEATEGIASKLCQTIGCTGIAVVDDDEDCGLERRDAPTPPPATAAALAFVAVAVSALLVVSSAIMA